MPATIAALPPASGPPGLGAALCALRPDLLAHASERAAQDAEDLVQETLLASFRNLSARAPATLTRAYITNYARRTLASRIANYLRHKAYVDRFEAIVDDAVDGEDRCSIRRDARCAAIAVHDDRALVNDAETLSGAKLRLRLAPLTPVQRECLFAWLRGEQSSVTARRMGRTRQSVHYNRRQAYLALRAVRIEVCSAPDLDHYAWRVGGLVTIYHAPEKTGAALAREKLKRMR